MDDHLPLLGLLPIVLLPALWCGIVFLLSFILPPSSFRHSRRPLVTK